MKMVNGKKELKVFRKLNTGTVKRKKITHETNTFTFQKTRTLELLKIQE